MAVWITTLWNDGQRIHQFSSPFLRYTYLSLPSADEEGGFVYELCSCNGNKMPEEEKSQSETGE